MSDGIITLLVIVGIVVFIVMISGKRPSQQSLDNEEAEKEHEIRMTEIQRRQEEADRRANEPSGKGKFVKAKKV